MLTNSLLIVDAYNTFMRSYCAYPAMSPQGEHVGGTVGFLKTLKRLVEELQPARCYVVWEGGGSSKRRSLYGAYKAQRRPQKLNRFYEDDLPDTEENKLAQVAWTLKLLKTLPICQLYVSDVEADDVIAHLVKRNFVNENKIILSTDKDMYQLLDDKTHIWDLNKKNFVTPETVKKTFFIPPRNFALAKTICGDGSDNIPGVKGVGFKTAAKRFPILTQDKDILLDEVVQYAAARRDESPVYANVFTNEELLKRNWRLVYLDGSMLSATGVAKLEKQIENFTPSIDKLAFIRAAQETGSLTHLDVDGTLYSLRNLYYGFQAQAQENKVAENV